MTAPSPLLTPYRTVLGVLLFAIVAALIVLVEHFLGQGDDEPVAEILSIDEAPVSRPPKRTVRDEPVPKRATIMEPPPIPEEDLWAMVPDEHQLREIQEADFLRLGGINTPGADPKRGRAAVNEPEWEERFEEELERGLNETILIGGTEVHQLECERGRCLIELHFEDMQVGLGRVGALREWLTERIDCRAYSEGPIESDNPFTQPSQQIYVLCGEPDSSRWSKKRR